MFRIFHALDIFKKNVLLGLAVYWQAKDKVWIDFDIYFQSFSYTNCKFYKYVACFFDYFSRKNNVKSLHKKVADLLAACCY